MFNGKITEMALDELQGRRRAAQNLNKAHFDEIHKNVPKVAEITRELAKTSSEFLRVISTYSGKEKENEFERLRLTNLEFQGKLERELKAQGYPADYLDVKYTCGVCNDTGYVGGQRCVCMKKLLAKIAAEDLDEKYHAGKKTFETFSLEWYKGEKSPAGRDAYDIMRDTLNYCKDYAERFSENSESLLLMGLTGLGKSHLSFAIANVAVRRGYGIICESITECIRQIEAEHFSRAKHDTDTLAELLEVDFLILDDLGSEFKTDFNESVLYSIVNTRLNKLKPTLISTNYTASELELRYNTRIVSRLLYNYRVIPFIGRDVRQKASSRR